VVITDSEISDLLLTGDSITIISSSLDFSDVTVSKINSTGDYDFMLVSFESSLNIQNIHYSNSNTILFNLRSSKMTASNLTFANVHNKRYLFEIYGAIQAKIHNINVSNVSTSSQSVILLKKSTNLELESMEVENITQIIIEIDRSHFKVLSGLIISNSEKALLVKTSTIEVLKDSSFTGNGNSNSRGGAIQMYNSDVTILNSTVSNNTANIGAGIHFD
jgi:hypothetical protein